MSIAAAASLLRAADKEAPFKAQPATAYSHQTNDKVTIGVDAYAFGEKLKAAFGKLDPNEYGVLPVLVVIQNDSGKTLRLSNMKVEYVGPGNTRVEATPASEVRFLNPPGRPQMPNRSPLSRKKKNPLDAWEIQGRAFVADTLPSGNSASGFFYFQAEFQTGATIYVSGLKEAGTGRELFYFEIPVK